MDLRWDIYLVYRIVDCSLSCQRRHIRIHIYALGEGFCAQHVYFSFLSRITLIVFFLEKDCSSEFIGPVHCWFYFKNWLHLQKDPGDKGFLRLCLAAGFASRPYSQEVWWKISQWVNNVLPWGGSSLLPLNFQERLQCASKEEGEVMYLVKVMMNRSTRSLFSYHTSITTVGECNMVICLSGC